ncbi:Serpentine Receptor, class E (Epsilon) [Caenorhabditis elegans]|uniref:Serpentine Receptor, class E (Epsilon) n=1 Tax=Caenorhabditis elegans TaxID=6239 RepID=Q9XTV9_CAEEL|nr:Serpentine Receptor, class E (Epsilon) [Caenorhabditis elegans]CAB07592.1 Serpentine Receptor, class E (Epsilon) [Caenorhabditis elegans]|eukprot:NP_507096.1 Uncharacterized protein CELE_F21H7.3 [Caenorhabditis elegans]
MTHHICYLVILNLFFLIIPIWFLSIGFKNQGKCENPLLPLWLIFVGILIIIDRIIYWKILFNKVKKLMEDVPQDGRKKNWFENFWWISIKYALEGVMLIAVALGAIWSYEQLGRPIYLCKSSVLFSVSGFCIIASITYIVSLIGTIYIFCMNCKAKFDRKVTMWLYSYIL